ncbi:unnamed protein product [Periconia digitata]|uniref:NmrA-like domain-containing protein n=1 Tax=Periconia digitata TaxID=1303443 RepID=A0A9W4U752_9PLEO|nr:unnamed protein product [Periconia digitata]
MTSQATKILLIGGGALGSAFIPYLSKIPNSTLTLGVRNPSAYASIAGPGVTLQALDTKSPPEDLVPIYADFDIIISAAGFGPGPDGVTQLVRDVLQAGKIRQASGKSKLWFFPWQWGVDYDIAGDLDGAHTTFKAQVEVRRILRAGADASHVKWTIVSTGIFLGVLFDPGFGTFEKRDTGIKIRALNDWDHKVTVTHTEDIGKILPPILAGQCDAENKVLYIAGDTISYRQFADIVERVTGKQVEREAWSIPHLQQEMEKDPDDMNKQYRRVFAGPGVWWDKELTLDKRLGVQLRDAETCVKELL